MVQTGLIGGSSLKISFSNGLALLIVGLLKRVCPAGYGGLSG